MPKETLSNLAYQGAPMKHNGMVVKAFSGSKRTIICEVDLPMITGPRFFQVTFQVMEIYPVHICLLGRP